MTLTDVVTDGFAPCASLGDAGRGLLPAAAFSSLAYQAAEDAAIWSRLWVCVGFAAEIPSAGDVLPFTVGHHGIHLERLANGTIQGRFNKAQHGGCRVVPLQCRTGTKTKCSFTACGHSRDRGPILTGDADRDAQLDQYFGLRPERLLPIAVETWGTLLLVRLDPSDEVQSDWPDVGASIASCDSSASDTRWREISENWKRVASRLAASDLAVTVLVPNVVIQRADEHDVVAILQPTALDRTLCRIRVFGRGTPLESAVADAAIDRLLCCACVDGDDATSRSSAFESAIASAIDAPKDEEPGQHRFRTDERRGW